jgi:hypothetical protein
VVAQPTLMFRPLVAESETEKFALTVPLLPSVTDTSPIETVGGTSSSTIVPTPRESPIVAFVAFERSTK